MDEYSKQMLAHYIVAFVDDVQSQWHDTNVSQNP